MAATEKYCPKIFFVELGGFSPNTFNKFIKDSGIEFDEVAGYPVFAVMKAMHRRSSSGAAMDIDHEMKKAKLDGQRIVNSVKMRKLIDRQAAVDRMRVTLQAIAGKIQYGAKLSAPRLPGVMNVRDIENIIVEGWESAIDSLTEEAERLLDWEDYALSIQSEGERLATSSQEDISSGDSEEDTSTDEIEYSGQNQSGLDAIFNRSSI